MNRPHDPSRPADVPSASADPLGTTDHVSGSATTVGPAGPPGPAAPAEGLPEVPGYRVLREIARGGMGRVLAAFDLILDRLEIPPAW